MTKNNHWWQRTTIFQIYPRSFKDSNDDGIGDIRGIISKLDYIKDLGFETIWISPFFASPQQDWGYDVSDYLAIAPEYGTLADVEELIHEIHSKEMRVLFDLVLNHTSDQHPWFQESRKSRSNPKRNWYIWQDGRGKKPPNNWKSIIGGSGWNFDQNTEQWYYSSFLPFQPDLNYRNPEVVDAILNIVRYWLDKGVDGFRLDIFHSLYKDKYFRNNPLSLQFIPDDFTAGYFQKWQYNLNQPETILFVEQLRELIDTYSPERLLLGEIFAEDAKIKEYLGPENSRMNLVFLWDLKQVQPDTEFLKGIIKKFETHYPEPFTPVYVYGNHDSKRLMTRLGQDERTAALLALFQFTVRGVPVTYYGEEIGMSGVSLSASNAKDPLGRRYKNVPAFLLRWLDLFTNRDECRTPMQWKNTDNAGFCGPGVDPWLPLNNNYTKINAEIQSNSDGSLLRIYQEILKIRKGSKALHSGRLELVDIDQILAYKRIYDQESLHILINFSSTEKVYQGIGILGEIIFFIGDYEEPANGEIVIGPHSGLIFSGSDTGRLAPEKD